MADSAGGYNPGTSMLQTNPDASLKVFMGGGVPGADGGAGLDYRNDVSMLQQNPGAVLQKFEGGAITVPGAKGEGRLLEDVMQLTDTKPYTERNYVVRSVEELREKFGNEVAYNDFILWLGRKLKGNGGFEEFVKARFLRIEEGVAGPRAKRRTRDEIIADELQKSIEKIKKAQDDLDRLQKMKEELDNDLKTVKDGPEKAETLTRIEGAKARTVAQITRQKKALITTITTGAAIPTMNDTQLQDLADGTEKPVETVGLKPTGASTTEETGQVVEVVDSSVPVVEAPAPVVVEEAPVPVVVEEAPVPVVEALVPAPVTQGGARKPKRTLKRSSKKARRTYKRK
jgi:hypothetical protein